MAIPSDAAWDSTVGAAAALARRRYLWDCHHGSNQEFVHTSSGQLQTLGLCLDVYNKETTAGTKVDPWPCNGQTNQQWTTNSNGTITSAQSGLCLDVKGGGDCGDGNPIDIWPCNGGANQQWSTG